MPRQPIPTWTFALVVVRRGDRFLLVHERKHGGGWFLPAGRVESRERIAEAALRETREEGGLRIRLLGVVRVEHSPIHGGEARLRVIFLAEPADDAPPKSQPDDESLGADWFRLEDLPGLTLRGEEVVDVLRYVAEGGAIAPLSILAEEGDAWSRGPETARGKPGGP